MNAKPKRPRLVAVRVASYNTNQAMSKFQENLNNIRNDISEDTYRALQKCNTVNEAVIRIKAFLDNKYVIELDQLYSSLFRSTITRYVTI